MTTADEIMAEALCRADTGFGQTIAVVLALGTSVLLIYAAAIVRIGAADVTFGSHYMRPVQALK